MNILIQDTNIRSSYFLGEQNLTKFEVPQDTLNADVVFMVPSEFLMDEVPASRSTDGPISTIAIVDPTTGKAYQIERDALDAFEIDHSVSVQPDTVAFAIPSSLESMTEVPIFRRSLVQYSS